MDEVPCKLGETCKIFDSTAKVWGGDRVARLRFHPQTGEEIAITPCP